MKACPDATRFPRAVEVSTRGAHEAELSSWKVESTRDVGPITLTVKDNPAYTPLKDDSVDHAAPGKMTVSLVSGGGEAECTGLRQVETGGLGFGPAIPAGRFSCPGSSPRRYVQPSDYRPTAACSAPRPAAERRLRVRFQDMTFGKVLHGHAGIEWDSTAHRDEPPVTLVWKVGDRTLGRIQAGSTDGWKSFALEHGRARREDGRDRGGGLLLELEEPPVLLRGRRAMTATHHHRRITRGRPRHRRVPRPGLHHVARRQRPLPRLRARRGVLLPRRARLRALVPAPVRRTEGGVRGRDGQRPLLLQPRAPGPHEGPVRPLVRLPPPEAPLLHRRQHGVPVPRHVHGGDGALGDLPLRGPRVRTVGGVLRRGAARAHAARVLQRAPRLLRRADHGDVDAVHLRLLAGDAGRRRLVGARAPGSSTG